ncbi:alpha/beta hydrolase [Sinomicrobium soli]|uniref:alpha/beta hydrolase n=1 Tax=Sinomicrobium sp. N-1-3-6 TaxID=2219864 RepID=UPI0013751E72|nr:alpha/beta hydrolase [Sinomicrobium sp. N-1-3-6]
MLLLYINALNAQRYSQTDTYKKTDQRDLNISFVYPDGWEKRMDWPVLVFFHGGGWIRGTIKQFDAYARYFADKGMVCALVEYRLKEKDGTDPFTALQDAKSAVRYIKSNASRYRIDPDRMVLSGSSAGGHLAAACELVEDFNDPGDDLSVSTRAAALVLIYPVVDNGPDGYGYGRIGTRYTRFSPYHQKKKGMADALVILGTKDKLVPVKTAREFCENIRQEGGHAELILYKGAGHGWFYENRPRGVFYLKALNDMESFLQQRDFLSESFLSRRE